MVDVTMGKIDDMRRAREQQFADRKAPASVTTSSAPVDANADERGRCADCGKMKPVTNGLVANHQKGLGKACAGSRKKPV